MIYRLETDHCFYQNLMLTSVLWAPDCKFRWIFSSVVCFFHIQLAGSFSLPQPPAATVWFQSFPPAQVIFNRESIADQALGLQLILHLCDIMLEIKCGLCKGTESIYSVKSFSKPTFLFHELHLSLLCLNWKGSEERVIFLRVQMKQLRLGGIVLGHILQPNPELPNCPET